MEVVDVVPHLILVVKIPSGVDAHQHAGEPRPPLLP